MYVTLVPHRNSKPPILIRKGGRIGPNQVKKITRTNISKLPLEIVQPFRVILRGGPAVGKPEEAFKRVIPSPTAL